MVLPSSGSSSSSSSSSASVGCQVTLHFNAVSSTSLGYLATITVDSAQCVPFEIFVFQRVPGTLGGLGLHDEFSHVASPADIEEYAVGKPEDDSSFYRSKSITLVFGSLKLLKQSLRDLKSDVNLLIETIRQTQDMAECVFIGDGAGVSACSP